MRSYTLDTNAARQANANSYIDTTGKYKGVFTRAEAITSKKGTEGIEFTFKSDEKQTADFLTLWTYNKDGQELYGLKVLNALMTCMSVRELQPSQGQVPKWDGGTRNATVFAALMNKPVGVLLQKEEYEKDDGSIGYKFNIFAPFHAQSEMTAKEILDKATKPEGLANMLSRLAVAAFAK